MRCWRISLIMQARSCCTASYSRPSGVANTATRWITSGRSYSGFAASSSRIATIRGTCSRRLASATACRSLKHDTYGGVIESVQYEIRIEGVLDERWSSWFDGLDITSEPGGVSVITGRVADQGALH